MRQTAQEQVKGWIFYVIVIGLAAGGIAIGLALGGKGVTAGELQTRLIEACESGRAPLQVYFGRQLIESERQSIKELQQAFPEFPPDEIRRSIRRERRNLRTLLGTYDPALCDDQYR